MVKARYLECKAALASAKQSHKKKEKAYDAKAKDLRKEEQGEKKMMDKAKKALGDLKRTTDAAEKAKATVEEQFNRTEEIEEEIGSFTDEKKNHDIKVRQLEADVEQLAKELEVWLEKEKRGHSDFTPKHQARHLPANLENHRNL